MSSRSSSSSLSLLHGLGKATKRGVRKCPKCGTSNGTRGLSCKNRVCDMIFKEANPASRAAATVASSAPSPLPQQQQQQQLVLEDLPGQAATTASWECSRLITEDEDQGVTGRRIFSLQQQQELLPSSSGTDAAQIPQNQQGFVVLDDSCPEQAGKQRQLNQDEEEDSSLKPGNYWQQQQQQPSGSPSRHRCFFPGCSNQADDACAHISLCLSLSPEQQSSMFAQALLVKHSVLNQMSISPDLKHEIWLGARRNGPLVQRVSTTTMVVKCGESEHPLGYLHVVFDHKNRTEPRMWCSCADRGDQQGCCFHFYACIAVFASDEKLSEEFGFFIALQHELADDNSMKQVITILGHDENGDTIQVEVLDKEQIELLTQNNYVTAANEEEDPQEIVQVNALNFAASAMASSSGSEGPAAPVINFNAEDLPISLIVSEDGTLQAAAKEQPQQELVELRPPVREESPLKPRSRRQPSSKSALLKRPHAVPEIIADLDVPGMTDETLASISFTDWLSGVTEAINESMHYDANGDDPEPLIFLAPAGFFNCLRDRMSVGGRGGGGGVFEEGPVKKSRLPNDSRTGYRSATPGVGMFTTYVWKIRNILLLKKVFDTPKVPLEITRSFVPAVPEDPPTGKSHKKHSGRKPPSSSHHGSAGGQVDEKDLLKTFLRVGPMSTENPGEGQDFVIEWTPNILPVMMMGELRIKFKFGRQKYGKVERQIN